MDWRRWESLRFQVVSRAVAAALLLLEGCALQPIGQLEQDLSAQDSATAVLNQRCAAHAPVVAIRVTGQDAPLPADARRLLEVGHDEPLGYRHVRLSCKGEILSEAHNWFVPGRLLPEMNAALRDTDMPFGKVVSPLHFTRERLASERGWAQGCPAGTVLRQRGLLRLPDGRPISLVVECYQKAALEMSSSRT